jgi:predicted RNase H-like HicB family nuclease
MKSSELKDYLQKYKMDIQWSEADCAYLGSIPELEGCITHGDTPEQAMEMLQEAGLLYLQTLLDDGDEIPVPLSLRNYSGKFQLRITPQLHAKLAQLAKSCNKSLNSYVESILSEHSFE